MNKLNLGVELTNRCNFRCTFCPHSHYGVDHSPGGNLFNRAKGFIGESLFQKTVVLAEQSARSLGFGFFGEPTLHPDFDAIVQLVPETRAFSFEINTNFSTLDQTRLPILDKFDHVKISLDACDSRLYDELCASEYVVDLSGRVLRENRLAAIEEKLEYWLALPRRSSTRIVYVESSRNAHQTEAFVKKWRDRLREQDTILCKSVISYGGVVADEGISPNPCKALDQNWFMVAWNGDCTTCNLDVNIDLCVGNLDRQSYEEMVVSPAYATVLRNIKEKRGICINCPDANNWSKNRRYSVIGKGQR